MSEAKLRPLPADVEPITNDNYADEMSAVVIAVGVLTACRVDELLAIVDKAETLGPILEPTAYQRGGHERLRKQRRLLGACADLLRVWEQIEKENAAEDGAR